MNRLISRPWFGPALGAFLYLAGFNDELLHLIGDAWLDLGRLTQTVVVLVALALVGYFVSDYLRQRHSAYQTAVRAAHTRSSRTGSVEGRPSGGDQLAEERS